MVGLIAIAIGGLWGATQLSNRLGPEAAPLQTLDDGGLMDALEALRAEQKLVGIAAKIVLDGDVIAEAATGFRTDAEDTPLLVSDPFHFGSIGKSMTATVIARLVEAGQMTWDDTIGERLKAIPHDPAWADVSLEHLLTHRAAIPPPPLSYMVNQVTEPNRLAEIRRDVAGALLKDPPATAPGSAYAYSNTGYMLAALMAEEATGQPWETLVQTALFSPLSLSSAGFGAPTGDVPFGHRKMGPFKFPMNANEDPADNPPWMAAAGTLHMTLDDLLRYGQAHLDAGASEGALLSPATFARLHQPALRDYAYGWIVQTQDIDGQSVPILWHNGSNTLWYALLVLLPEQDSMFVIATNDGSNLGRTQGGFDDLSHQIIAQIVAR